MTSNIARLLHLTFISFLLSSFVVYPLTSFAQIETGAITINPDGTVTPPSSHLVKNGNIYKLEGDVFGRIIIEKDDIVLDGNSFLVQNIVSESTVGIKIDNVKNVKIINIRVKEFGYGISIKDSQDILIQHSSLEFNSFNGIEIIDSENVEVYDNYIFGNQRGIEITDGSSQNRIYENLIQDNNFGISIEYSSNNQIYNNDFKTNSEHVKSFGSENVWDMGYSEGGNFWSQTTFMDQYSGISQNQPGSDGFSDEPYDIDETNFDNYPFIDPIDTEQPVLVEKTNLVVNVEDESGSPLEGVTITIESDPDGSNNYEAITGVTGDATLSSINTGQYTITIEKTDYHIEKKPIIITDSENTLTVQLERFPLLLVFYIKDNAGDPVIGAKAESINLPINQNPLSGTSNEDGVIVFETKNIGTYSWKITALGFEEKTLQIDLPGQDVNEIILTEIQSPPVVPGFSQIFIILGILTFTYITKR